MFGRGRSPCDDTHMNAARPHYRYTVACPLRLSSRALTAICLSAGRGLLAAVPLLLGAGLLTLAPTHPAVAQTDAYSVEVAVASRSPDERQDAYQVALRRVLLANSGDKTLMNRDDVREALQQAEAYVETYRFRIPEPGTLIPSDTPITAVVRDSGEAIGLLMVRFDRDSVLALINQESSTVAADQEAQDGEAVDPFAQVDQALVWLLIDDTDRAIRGVDRVAGKVRERLREIAGGGGVALVFPTDDAVADGVPDNALRSLNIDLIREASVRYSADVVLVGHLTRAEAADAGIDANDEVSTLADQQGGVTVSPPTNGSASGGWVGSWVKFAGDQSQSVQTGGETLDDVLRGGIAWLGSDPTLGQPAEYVYGGSGSSTEGLVLIDGIESLRDYAQLNRLLASVPGVSASWAREISGNSMVFAVLPRGALGAVSSALDTTSWLRRGGSAADRRLSDVARNAELLYDVVR